VFSAGARFVLDGNITVRISKARAADKLGVITV
jgi:hypothetical protein